MIKLNKKKYYNYQELTDFLFSCQEKFPHWIRIESIGKSPEGRDLWLVSLTDFSTGLPEDKPSLWIDGNTHASEITGAQSCLYMIAELLNLSRKRSSVAGLLKTMNFYFLPVVSPDGAESFHRTGYELRSSPRQWPNPPLISNLEPADLDGDGEILMMRKQDPSGVFCLSKKNSQLMIARDPFDFDDAKKYFHLFPEGSFRQFDDFKMSVSSDTSFDYNRQFPNNFRPEGRQFGAGEFPMSSPEIYHFVRAFTARPRIFGHIALHTYGGLILRPPGMTPESRFDLKDLLLLKTICDEGEKVSGYSSLSIQKDFKYYSRESESGDAIEWTFEQRGVFSMTVEIWDLWKEVGITVSDHVSRYFAPREADLLKIYSWAQRKLGFKKFFKPWKKWKHPQLGEVEIGGWKTNFLFRNPPHNLLEREMKKVFKIAQQFAKATPKVLCRSVKVESVQGSQKKIKMVFENQGLLATYGSQQALRVGAVRKPRVELELSRGQKLVSGAVDFEIEHLQGRERFLPISTPVRIFRFTNSHQVLLEWIIEGKGTITVSVDFQRGGRIQQKIEV